MLVNAKCEKFALKCEVRKPYLNNMLNKEWLKAALRKSGKTTSDLAEAIQRDRAVVSRIMNGKQQASIDQAKVFASVLDVPVSEALSQMGLTDEKTAQTFSPGFSESDAAVWIGKGGQAAKVQSTAATLGGEKPGVDIWSVKSLAMSQMGIMPGDFMLIDTHQASTCRAGDIVVAQVYDWQTGGATTLLRRYEPPVLVAASPDRDDARVYVVDGNNVAIMGKIIATWRQM